MDPPLANPMMLAPKNMLQQEDSLKSTSEAAGNRQPPSLRVRTHFEMVIRGYHRVVLSAPAVTDSPDALRSKDLLPSGPGSSDGKYTLEEHLDLLSSRSEISPRRSLVAIGLRNNLVNPRAIVIHRGKAYAADGERPEASVRPYFGVGLRAGRFVVESVLGSAGSLADAPEFICTGVPVLWDDLTREELFDRILSEASDHSHVFEIHRGNHPRATAASRSAWQSLHEVFRTNLYAEADRAAKAMREAVARLPMPPQRADNYLHSVLGANAHGELINVVAHGRLEELGQRTAELGCRRAICVENSGSIMPTYYPRGYSGPVIPLLRAPNFRPPGRTLLVIELENDAFDVLPLSRVQSE